MRIVRKIRTLLSLGTLACACGAPLPQDGGASCTGGVGFAPCPTPTMRGAQPPATMQECSAQLGFENDDALVRFDADPHPNAFGPYKLSTRRALCGTRALELPANFVAASNVTQGHVGILTPDLTQGSGTLSLWVYLEGPASPALEVFLALEPVPTSNPFLGPLPVGVWTRIQSTFADVPVALDVEKKVSFRLFSPVGDWSGVVHLDEVKWQPD